MQINNIYGLTLTPLATSIDEVNCLYILVRTITLLPNNVKN